MLIFFYVLGETYGPDVQDMYYDLSKREFRVFDVFIGHPTTGRYLSYDEMLTAIKDIFTSVPELYRGPFNRDCVYHYANADDNESRSILANHMREGVVIRPPTEGWDDEIGRRILKCTGEIYDLRKNKNKTEYQ